MAASCTRSPPRSTSFPNPRIVLQPEILKPLMIEAVRLNNVMNLRIRFPYVGVSLIRCRAAHPAPGAADHAGGRLHLPWIPEKKHHRACDRFQDAIVFAWCSRPPYRLRAMFTASDQAWPQPYQQRNAGGHLQGVIQQPLPELIVIRRPS